MVPAKAALGQEEFHRPKDARGRRLGPIKRADFSDGEVDSSSGKGRSVPCQLSWHANSGSVDGGNFGPTLGAFAKPLEIKQKMQKQVVFVLFLIFKGYQPDKIKRVRRDLNTTIYND